MKPNKKAILYCRTACKADNGNALQEQVEECKAYAASHGYIVQHIFKEYAGGRGPKHPEWDYVLEYCKCHPSTTVIVKDPERISRNPVQFRDFSVAVYAAGGRIEYLHLGELVDFAFGRYYSVYGTH